LEKVASDLLGQAIAQLRRRQKERRDVTQTAAKTQPETAPQPLAGEVSLQEMPLEDSREWQAERLRLLWQHRRFLVRAAAVGLFASTLIAFLIPKSYTSTTQLMPPDSQSSSNLAMMAAMASKVGAGLGSVAGDLLGVKSSGAIFIGVLRSQTAQDRLVQQFDLRKVYGTRLMVDARTKLDVNTAISEDRKSGIITISVNDRSPQRAAALANAYVDELNTLVAELSTSSAHRERVFLEERLKVGKRDLDQAVNDLAQFSSKNNTLDIQQEGKAMLDAAGTLAGEMIVAQSELEGLRQIYTDNTPRVRSLNARVEELRKQLEKLGGTNASGDRSASLAADRPGDLPAAPGGGLPYPTIHSLPLLEAKYADYYRRAKIQETVYELLTEQFELAKVQEAKETPSVKVLDPGTIPEKKSYPPRLLIMLAGTFLVSTACVGWVLGADHWKQTDGADPRKILAKEVVAALHAPSQWFSRNGAEHRAAEEKDSKRRDMFQP
jgi:capsule polysaccharide export protein KpsE/RkpR